MAGQTNLSQFASAMGASSKAPNTEVVDRPTEQPDADQSLTEELFAKTGATLPPKELLENQEELQEEAEKKKRAQKQHDRVNPSEEDVVEIHARQTAKDAQELNELQQQFVDMAKQKGMKDAERPKIIEARVVDPGERKYVFTDLFNLAKNKIENYIPKPPYEIAKKRKAKKSGLIANPEETAEVQDTYHHERASNTGA